MKNKMRHCNLLLSTVLLFGTILNLQAQDKNDFLTKVENSLMPNTQIIDSSFIKFNIVERMKFYGVNAVSIAVVDNGKIGWAKAYGYADVKTGRLATPTTIFDAESITKSLNSLCIFKLSEAGKLFLDKDIRQYLKTWQFPDNEFSKGHKITLLNLLSHSAGLNVHGFGLYSEKDSIPTIDQLLNGLAPATNEKVVPLFMPGTKYQYSSGGFMITQKILQDNISPDYSALMKNTVLKPLGLQNSSVTVRLSDSQKANAAVGYIDDEIPGKYAVLPYSAAGGLWTTATDLGKFVIAIQNMYAGKSKALLSQSSARQMLTPVLDTATYQLSYQKAKFAPGFFLIDKGGETYFFHSGGQDGYSSIYYGGLQNGKGAVIMVNSSNTQIIFEILNAIAFVYNWKDFYQPQLKTAVNITDPLLSSYQGEYIFDDLGVAFSVQKEGNALYLRSKSGGSEYSDSERMYSSTSEKFFLLSNKLEFKFVAEKPGEPIDIMYIKSGDSVLKGKKK